MKMFVDLCGCVGRIGGQDLLATVREGREYDWLGGYNTKPKICLLISIIVKIIYRALEIIGSYWHSCQNEKLILIDLSTKRQP